MNKINWNIIIHSQEELEDICKKEKLKRYMNYQENFDNCFKIYPLLNRFATWNSFAIIIRTDKINKYLEYELIPYPSVPLTSLNFNRIINAIERKRLDKLKLKKFVEQGV